MYYKVSIVGTERVVIVQDGKQFRVHTTAALSNTLDILAERCDVSFDEEHLHLMRAILRDLEVDRESRDSHYVA